MVFKTITKGNWLDNEKEKEKRELQWKMETNKLAHEEKHACMLSKIKKKKKKRSMRMHVVQSTIILDR